MHYYVFMNVVVDRSHEIQFNTHLPSPNPSKRTKCITHKQYKRTAPHEMKTFKKINYKNHKQNKLCTSVRRRRCYSQNLITASFARIALCSCGKYACVCQRIPSIHSCKQFLLLILILLA